MSDSENDSIKRLETSNRSLGTNWDMTLNAHRDVIIELMKKTELQAKWTTCLAYSVPEKGVKIAKRFMDEMFMDLFTSIVLALQGLYKYARMCLRSYLESTVQLIFFAFHPLEYKWWTGRKWGYLSSFRKYLGIIFKIAKVHEMDQKYNAECLRKKVENQYHTDSAYVHSSGSSIQTSDAVAPQYKVQEFMWWKAAFESVVCHSNMMLIASFYEHFCSADAEEREAIIEIGIQDAMKDFMRRFVTRST